MKKKSPGRGGARKGAGRPSDSVRVTVSIRLKRDVHERFKTEAQARKTSVSKIIADRLEGEP
jgi:uncharacterized protein (DUF4415 family)